MNSRWQRWLVWPSAGLVLAAALFVGCRDNGTTPAIDDKGGTSPVAGDPGAETGPAYFQEMTAGSGVDHTYKNGQEAEHYAILESLGGGVALFDYDGDGLLDLFLPGGGYFAGEDKKQLKGHPNRLFKNLGGWKFKEVTKEAGLDAPRFYTHGAAVADYDNDGRPDLLVTGWGRLALFHNEGDGRFREVTKEAGLLDKEHFWGTSAGFADFDGDGLADLYVCQYVNWSFEKNHPHCPGYTTTIKQDVCPPKQFQSVPHALYHNLGKGKFRDVTKEAGLRVQRADGDYGKGLGVILVDINGDRRPDIYVANDTTDNFLYLNQCQPGKLRFDDVGLETGVGRDDRGIANGSMGLAAADIDGSGRPALWVTNYENELHALYLNTGKYFRYYTRMAGIAVIGQVYVGFGTAFLDLDNDGWEDLAVANGHVIRHPPMKNLLQRPVLLRHLGIDESGNAKFGNVTARGGPYFRGEYMSRGLACGDLDNDGRPDLVVCHTNAPVSLLRNVDESKNRWLGMELAGKGHRDLVGAKVVAEVGGRKLTRFVQGGGSYLSANDPRKLFGLGTAEKIDRLTVEWPTAEPATQTWEGGQLTPGRYWRLVQGEAAPRPAKP